MQVRPTEIAGVLVIEPRVFEDPRGFFMETFNRRKFAEAGLPDDFVQDNHSASCRGTLRGLHCQVQHAQGKLVRCVRGAVFDVAADIRPGSPTFGRWVGVELSESNRQQMYIAPGLAHGFCATSEAAEICYKCTDFYYPEDEQTIAWNDPQLAIAWPIADPILSEKDRRGISLAEVIARNLPKR